MAVAKTAQQKASDRAMLRRARRRQERELAAKGGAVDVDTGERYAITVTDATSPQDRKRAPAVEEHLKTLRMPDPAAVEEKALRNRQRYAPMRKHMEIAANVLAAGGTKNLAAQKAGVHRRQITKYLSQADFRDRVAEIHDTLAVRIRGKIMKEVNRRTSPELIEKMELLDLLRVGDRFGLGRGAASVIVNDNREVHNYESVFNQLFHNSGPENPQRLSDAEEESADFPEFEPTSLALSGGDSPIEG